MKYMVKGTGKKKFMWKKGGFRLLGGGRGSCMRLYMHFITQRHLLDGIADMIV